MDLQGVSFCDLQFKSFSEPCIMYVTTLRIFKTTGFPFLKKLSGNIQVNQRQRFGHMERALAKSCRKCYCRFS